jgi:hypothetical protein
LCVVLELELRAYTLSHSTNPFLWRFFFSRYGLTELFTWAASNRHPPDLCLLSARITGISHWRLVLTSYLMGKNWNHFS